MADTETDKTTATPADEAPAEKAHKPAKKAPTAKVVPDEPPAEQPKATPKPVPKPAPAPKPADPEAASAESEDFGRKAKDAVQDGMREASGWFEQRFPGYGNAVLFGIIGFVAALLLFSIGFWKMLLILVLVVAGVAYGQYLDGNPKIWNSIKGLFSKKD
ncbi:MAG: DUF2273 domain-containing protein [Atopobiaceae bacterium]|jgi:uncharacterized membrane protein|nr:DUF2273 domain-containing protein [Atopobiaceae bacterium]